LPALEPEKPGPNPYTIGIIWRRGNILAKKGEKKTETQTAYL